MEYYVYQHRRLKDGSIFYIGKGKNGRAEDTAGRNTHWNRIVKKDGGFDVEIIDTGLSDVEAGERETQLIAEIGLNNLSNMTSGGNGGDTRAKFTEEQLTEWRRKKSQVAMGRRCYWKGKSRPRHSKSIKKAHEEGRYTYEWLQDPKSEETRRRMSEASKGKPKPKTVCDVCNRTVSKNNLKSHQEGAKCIPVSRG